MGFLNKIPTVLVAYDEYINPTDEDLTVEALSGRWAPEAWALVSMQGVSLQNVCDAYKEIQQGKKIDMKRLGFNIVGAGALAAAVAEVAARITGSETSNETQQVQANKPAGSLSAEVAVMGDNMSGEAVSTAQVITSMIRQMLQMEVVMIFDPKDAQSVTRPRCVVVSFTMGVITSEPFALSAIAAHLAWKHTPRVTVQAPDFIFPAKVMLDNGIYAHMAKATGCDIGLVREVYDPLLSILAFRFGPSGNIAVMTEEIRVLCTRLTGQMEHASPVVDDRVLAVEQV